MSIANTPSNGWYTKNMSSSYFGYINKTGATQIRLRFATDDNNNRVADYLSFYAGEAGTTCNPPCLWPPTASRRGLGECKGRS